MIVFVTGLGLPFSLLSPILAKEKKSFIGISDENTYDLSIDSKTAHISSRHICDMKQTVGGKAYNAVSESAI